MLSIKLSMAFHSSSLQIERDTYGMLQCHPYPNEYVDTSKPCSHTAFFMGLQRKQGVKSQEAQQFDIRETVEEFRHEVNLFMFWKPGMEIYVSHVRRKQIPSFVFPDGYKRPRVSRPADPQQIGRASSEDGAEGFPKRRKNSADFDTPESKRGKLPSSSPIWQKSSSPPEPGDGRSPMLHPMASASDAKMENIMVEMDISEAALNKSTQKQRDAIRDDAMRTSPEKCGCGSPARLAPNLQSSGNTSLTSHQEKADSAPSTSNNGSSDVGTSGRRQKGKFDCEQDDLKPDKMIDHLSDSCGQTSPSVIEVGFNGFARGPPAGLEMAEGNNLAACSSVNRPASGVGVARSQEGHAIIKLVSQMGPKPVYQSPEGLVRLGSIKGFEERAEMASECGRPEGEFLNSTGISSASG